MEQDIGLVAALERWFARRDSLTRSQYEILRVIAGEDEVVSHTKKPSRRASPDPVASVSSAKLNTFVDWKAAATNLVGPNCVFFSSKGAFTRSEVVAAKKVYREHKVGSRLSKRGGLILRKMFPNRRIASVFSMLSRYSRLKKRTKALKANKVKRYKRWTQFERQYVVNALSMDLNFKEIMVHLRRLMPERSYKSIYTMVKKLEDRR